MLFGGSILSVHNTLDMLPLSFHSFHRLVLPQFAKLFIYWRMLWLLPIVSSLGGASMNDQAVYRYEASYF